MSKATSAFGPTGRRGACAWLITSNWRVHCRLNAIHGKPPDLNLPRSKTIVPTASALRYNAQIQSFSNHLKINVPQLYDSTTRRLEVFWHLWSECFDVRSGLEQGRKSGPMYPAWTDWCHPNRIDERPLGISQAPCRGSSHTSTEMAGRCNIKAGQSSLKPCEDIRLASSRLCSPKSLSPSPLCSSYVHSPLPPHHTFLS
jgi:hypothetical protein